MRNQEAIYTTPTLVEVIAYFGIAACFFAMMSIGDSNGLGVFQQPHESLTLPILTGIVLNGCVLYALVYLIVPTHFSSKDYVTLTLWTLALMAMIILLKASIFYAAILWWYPRLTSYSFVQLAETSTGFTLVFVLFGLAYGIPRYIYRRYKKLKIAVEIESGKTITFQSGKKEFRCKLNDILFFKGEGNYVKIKTTTAEELIYSNLYQIEANVPEDLFVRIHRSYIVSKLHVTQLGPNEVKIGDHSFKISAKFAETAMEKLRA